MAFPDHYHRLLQRLIDQAQPKSFEEFQELMKTLESSPLPEIPLEELTAEDRAFELVDEAWESSAVKGRKLALQALELWPDCIPAYEFLFSSAKSKKQRLEYIEKAVEIGKRLFGGEYLKKNSGHFWGIVETRPYMRSLQALAQFNAEEGNLSKAIVIWEDMLRLNPTDNQGIRYSLLPALLRQRDLKSYAKYRKKYPEDSAPFYFNDALSDFMQGGASAQANSRLKAAAANNVYIIPLLLHDAPLFEYPDSYMLGSPEEAQIYVNDAWPLWREIPGALEWLKTFHNGQKKRAPALPLAKLSRSGILLLINDPYSPVSPLQFRPELKDEEVAHVPFLQLTRELLATIHKEQPLKLTPKGNLPRAVVQHLYGLRLFPNEILDKGMKKLMSEEDFVQLIIAHALCTIAKWVQKRSGKAILTKKGLEMLQGPQVHLYRELLKIYTQEYNWAYTETWGFSAPHTGQAGWAMILYELLHQGNTPQSDKFYSGLYFNFLPDLRQQYQDKSYISADFQAQADVRRRFFYGFGSLFGLADIVREIKGKYDTTEELIVRRSVLAERVFQIS